MEQKWDKNVTKMMETYPQVYYHKSVSKFESVHQHAQYNCCLFDMHEVRNCLNGALFLCIFKIY